MKIIVFCVFAEIITVLSFNVYNTYNPYKRWIFQRHIPLFSYKINLVGAENLNGESNNNGVLETKHRKEIYDESVQGYKNAVLDDTHLNLDGKITELRKEDKTHEEDAANTILRTQSNLKNISSNIAYQDIESLSGLEREKYLKLSQTPYVKNYLSYYYGNNRNVPVNYYENNSGKGSYNYGIYKNNELNVTDVISAGKGTQDINTGVQSHYSYNSYLDNNIDSETNIKENNRIHSIVRSEVNALKDGTKGSLLSVTQEESQEDYNDKTRADSGSAETKENKSNNVTEEEENGSFKKAPCLTSLAPVISNEIKRTSNIEIDRNNLLETRLGDVYRNERVPVYNRGVCIHKCLTICT